ncbi:putative SnoaL-like aldol condensation-catalyzing enzyme [Kineococcus radiotolerans]|uniref:Putative SnoaL-like aldol condensation-catalyzing enzyme n=1 Tax=Kineococcus radiotolerans TaxID=131568 RepID=A0A7W4TQR7_KINRA|nr:ester cyclase [Kineococcus radiotolerans]MBB2903359.1 putative SnoaL-like aldol condensation-catalyzing enzyme [Kineococcus radiotolerans]
MPQPSPPPDAHQGPGQRTAQTLDPSGLLPGSRQQAEANKQLVLTAFDTLFNHRDYDTAATYWSEDYLQHSAHIAPGRRGLFDLVKNSPTDLAHEAELVMAENDLVMVRGRFSGTGRHAAWIAVDLVRIEDGRLKEHWDVLQDEATRAQSLSGLPMFGDQFPKER